MVSLLSLGNIFCASVAAFVARIAWRSGFSADAHVPLSAILRAVVVQSLGCSQVEIQWKAEKAVESLVNPAGQSPSPTGSLLTATPLELALEPLRVGIQSALSGYRPLQVI